MKDMSTRNLIKKVEKLYDERIISSNDAVKAAGQWGTNEYVALICDEIYKKVKIKKTDSVLELGCGSGVLGKYIKERCHQYVGVDLSQKMLNFFSEDSTLEQITLIQGITDLIPFSNHVFDIVIINGVTMYFPDDKILLDTLTEMKRVSKKDGTIFIGENIIPTDYAWEFTWFQNLSPKIQLFAKNYIKIRRWFSKKNPNFAGKWKDTYKEISPTLINQFFQNDATIHQSRAATYIVKKRILGKKYKGSRRVDFLINLQQ